MANTAVTMPAPVATDVSVVDQEAADVPTPTEKRRVTRSLAIGGVIGLVLLAAVVTIGVASVVTTNTAGANDHPDDKAIYGSDDPVYINAAPDAVRRVGNSVAALVIAGRMIGPINGIYSMTTGSYNYAKVGKDWLPLCPDVPFRHADTGAFCTATLITQDVIATAGHCFSSSDLSSFRVVFDFTTSRSTSHRRIPANNVYRPVEVLRRAFSSATECTGHDYGLIRLDRPVVGRRPVQMDNSLVSTGTNVYTIGFPQGLKMIYAPGAVVMSQSSVSGLMLYTLDSFGGNSGGGVFDASMHKLVGIHNCNESSYVRDTDRYGDDCAGLATYPETDVHGGTATMLHAVSGVPDVQSPDETSEAKIEIRVGMHRAAGTRNDVDVWCRDGKGVWIARWTFNQTEAGDKLVAENSVLGLCSAIAVCKGGTNALQVDRVRLLSPSNTVSDGWKTNMWLDTDGTSGCLYHRRGSSAVKTSASVCNGGTSRCT